MNGGAGFGVDGEKRLRLPGADSIRTKSEWHGIDPSVGAQVDPGFGKIRSTRTDMRDLQFGLKFVF